MSQLDFSPVIFYYANCFFEAFFTVLRVLTQFLLIFEVFSLFGTYLCAENVVPRCRDLFLRLILGVDSCVLSYFLPSTLVLRLFLAVFHGFWVFPTLDTYFVLKSQGSTIFHMT